jgi:hypothetical protein
LLHSSTEKRAYYQEEAGLIRSVDHIGDFELDLADAIYSLNETVEIPDKIVVLVPKRWVWLT